VKKTAGCSGCGARSRTFYDRTTRRVRDTDLPVGRQVPPAGASTWRLSNGGWPAGRQAGRTEADLDRFFLDLGPKKAARIRLAVMDMWKAFRNSVQIHAPQAQILFDKFPVLRHLADAMAQGRRAEYKRGAAKDRAYIKGQRSTVLSHRANLTLEGRRSLRKLLRANKRLATALARLLSKS
jgi:transposase